MSLEFHCTCFCIYIYSLMVIYLLVSLVLVDGLVLLPLRSKSKMLTSKPYGLDCLYNCSWFFLFFSFFSISWLLLFQWDSSHLSLHSSSCHADTLTLPFSSPLPNKSGVKLLKPEVLQVSHWREPRHLSL